MFGSMLTAEQYRELLARQDGGETLDLSGVVRPGIAGWHAPSGKLLILQGSGRFAKSAGALVHDLFVPMPDVAACSAVVGPDKLRVVRSNIAGELVRDINLLSSRGPSGANPYFVGAMTDGRSYARVRAHASILEAPMVKKT
ncbi:MAG: hypothetical protein KC503_12595 [Myxococcales bacterium]|nr:hypothetical protein [Myxococcales bacterium]